MGKFYEKFRAFTFAGFVFACFVVSSANAENQQDYVMNKAQMQHYIDLSREQVDKGNYSLARAYAKKAIQANAWDKLAWANYDDIIQRLADEGSIDDFGAILEESKASDSPKPSGGAAQFEGC